MQQEICYCSKCVVRKFGDTTIHTIVVKLLQWFFCTNILEIHFYFSVKWINVPSFVSLYEYKSSICICIWWRFAWFVMQIGNTFTDTLLSFIVFEYLSSQIQMHSNYRTRLGILHGRNSVVFHWDLYCSTIPQIEVTAEIELILSW